MYDEDIRYMYLYYKSLNIYMYYNIRKPVSYMYAHHSVHMFTPKIKIYKFKYGNWFKESNITKYFVVFTK